MPNQPNTVSQLLPVGLRIGAAASWRVLLIAAVVGVVGWVAGYLAVATLPVAIALLLSALFSPVVARLVRWRVPRSLATTLVIVFGLAIVGGVFTLVVITFVASLPELGTQFTHTAREVNTWLRDGPLGLSQAQLDRYAENLTRTLQDNQSGITGGAISAAGTLGEFGAGMLLTLFVLIFFLYDGDRIWRFTVRVVPSGVRANIELAGRRGFASLVSYVRATVVVATADGLVIGVALAFIGVPLAVPLATLVFLGAFVPIIGAVVSGAVAVLIALVSNGLLAGLVVLIVLIGVMQLEGHVLQPLLLGRAVRLHPLAVVIVIALGATIAGVAGALISVPLLAVANAGARSLLHESPPPPHPTDIDVHDGEHAAPGTGAGPS